MRSVELSEAFTIHFTDDSINPKSITNCIYVMQFFTYETKPYVSSESTLVRYGKVSIGNINFAILMP